jgi:PadR family transcriptional regulator, regulatory protein PadR
VRKTTAQVQVAMALLEDPTGRHWGYQLSKQTGVRSGVLYPMLTRFLDEGWLADGWDRKTPPLSTRSARPGGTMS